MPPGKAGKVSTVAFAHRPVLLEEVLAWLDPKPGGAFLDATLGGGGHSLAIVGRIGPGGRLVGIDRDGQALAAASARLRSAAPPGVQLHFEQMDYAHLETALDRAGVAELDGALFDLGVSSPQLDDPARGFSYWEDAPLDMRMDQRQALTARDLLHQASEDELRRILFEYGEERWAARIARFIVERRRHGRLETTGDLVQLIKDAIPAPARRTGPHPARRTFQALRIAVNDELGSLQKGLQAAANRLKGGGRIVVISFHSLEDRIVKAFFRDGERGCICPPRLPVCRCGRKPFLKVLTRRPVVPRPQEVAENPRARSAKLRAAEKVLPEGEGE